ncbi:hypothetical protein MTO96_024061 [Rhipicephalus appendiculatus]
MADFGSDDSQPLVVDLQEHQGTMVVASSSSGANAMIQRRAFARGPPPGVLAPILRHQDRRYEADRNLPALQRIHPGNGRRLLKPAATPQAEAPAGA